MTACTKLSPKAQAIFDQLEIFFPVGPFDEPRWDPEGKVFNNIWYDLRIMEERRRLIENTKTFIGHVVGLNAGAFRKKHGSLIGFTQETYSDLVWHRAKLLLILEDLDFQIETGDFVDP